eukprot:2285543-Prymnesium_polylepis.1
MLCVAPARSGTHAPSSRMQMGNKGQHSPSGGGAEKQRNADQQAMVRVPAEAPRTQMPHGPRRSTRSRRTRDTPVVQQLAHRPLHLRTARDARDVRLEALAGAALWRVEVVAVCNLDAKLCRRRGDAAAHG